MRTIGITFVFALLLIGLGFYVVQIVPPEIESSIASELKRKFAANDLTQIEIVMHGRDVTLVGDVESQAQIDLAMKLASTMIGVRSVMTDMVVIADQAIRENGETETQY